MTNQKKDLGFIVDSSIVLKLNSMVWIKGRELKIKANNTVMTYTFIVELYLECYVCLPHLQSSTIKMGNIGDSCQICHGA